MIKIIEDKILSDKVNDILLYLWSVNKPDSTIMDFRYNYVMSLLTTIEAMINRSQTNLINTSLKFIQLSEYLELSDKIKDEKPKLSKKYKWVCGCETCELNKLFFNGEYSILPPPKELLKGIEQAKCKTCGKKIKLMEFD